MKKNIASIELAALVKEFEFLTSGKISQVYQIREEFFFQFHKGGKHFLRIIPGKVINLASSKETALRPSGFCMQLRKHLNNSIVRKIKQKDSERILIIDLEKLEKYSLILELFPPGNIVLVDAKQKVIAALNQQKFKDRFIRPKEKYVFPPPTLNWKTITDSKLKSLFKKSTRKNLAVTLAIDLGLGGLYAEEVCTLSQIDKNKNPVKVTLAESKLLLQTLNQLISKKPAGFIYAEQITPFPLQDKKTIKETTTYSEGLATINFSKKVSPYEKKIKSTKKIIEEQEKSTRKQNRQIEKNNQKADLIYQTYQPLQKLIGIIKEMKKTKSWKEIKAELKKEKKIKKIDLKNKKILIDL